MATSYSNKGPTMIKQNKGKDLHKVPKSKLPSGPFYVSKKYDGHYVQIRYDGELVQMWTSGGKKFCLTELSRYIRENFKDSFHIECEFNYSCEGLLGDRGLSAILTTYRTNYGKRKPNAGDAIKDIFRVLDRLDSSLTFKDRLDSIVKQFSGKSWFMIPHQYTVSTLDDCAKMALHWQGLGYEGAMVKDAKHRYQAGKRVNDIIKLKPRLTADLLCVGWNNGEQTGKYADSVGSLILRDSQGREVSAGSGLSDAQRSVDGDSYVGTVWEIEYERIDDTYIQPVIKYQRKDKTAEEID